MRARCCAALLVLAGCGGAEAARGAPEVAPGPERAAEAPAARGDGKGAEASAVEPHPAARPEPLVAGGRHTCRLHEGAVWCWGDNDFGQLGDGTRADRWAPVRVRHVDDAVEIAAGPLATCARERDGAIRCWGHGLGPEGRPEESRAFAVPDGADVAQLAVGHERLVLRTRAGQLLETTGGPLRRLPLEGVVHVALGSHHACALDARRAVHCWGAGHEGQLGGGDAREREQESLVIEQVAELWAWGSATLVRRRDGSLRWWGRSRAWQAQSSRPVAPSGAVAEALAGARDVAHGCVLARDGALRCGETRFSKPAIALAAGASHRCALHDDGAVTCAGANDRGQLGRGSSSEGVGVPTAVAVPPAAQVVTGEWSACSRTPGGRVHCWSREQPAPRRIAVPHAAALHEGGQYTCAVDRRGAARCWGLATWRQCVWRSADNCQPERWDSPRRVEGLAGVRGAVELEGDCGRRPSGAVRCAERYEGGEARPLPGVDDAVELAGGPWLRCVRRRSGRIACLFRRAGEPLSPPAELEGVDDAVDLSASRTHVCAVRKGGSVWCTPTVELGQRCDSPQAACARLRRVEGIDDAAEVATGAGFSCVRRRGGGVACWGSGEHGVLGDGTTRDRGAPTPVEGLDDAAELVAYIDHVCARREGGEVLCWGRLLPGPAQDETPAPVRAAPWR